MELVDYLWGIVLFALFLTCILFVTFGQITVRKLRKNTTTKESLGVEFASGWDILNVAEALALPKVITDRFEGSPISVMFASADVLRKNTNTFDKVLAALFFWLFVFTGVSLLVLSLYMTLFVD
ncbi:hypothetical protein [Motiliproteus sp. MSK22-1]|uniref:hypothetical protein n=1 Tax=Motiliproteus sp. MSK22-1 TaxID=1897630 RepID=UPI00097619A2|nr:hypothetical protein [Motiliproteus sp. MSK22-1]OMH39518.1 hypothetical protein BGP75_02695 [Motiliproteus sp. MSK22-1]